MSFKINMGGVVAKIQRICSNRQLGAFLASEAESGMKKYVPRRTGALMDSSSTQPFRIHYGMKYAVYPFYGRNMKISRQKNINATSRWDRAYAIAEGEKLGEAGTAFIKRL